MNQLIPKRIYWLSGGLLILLCLLCLFLFLKAREKTDQEYNEQIQTVGSLATQDFERTVNNNIASLENLKNRIEESEGAFFEFFESDSKRIIAQNPALKFIEYIDKEGVIRKIVPFEGNEQVLNLDIKPIEYRYEEWRENSKKNITNITPWVKLTQGGHAFLVDVPIYYNNTFHGTVSAGMDFSSQFDQLGDNLKDHAILIKDESGTAFYNYNNPQPNNFPTKRRFTSKLYVDPDTNSAWSFEFLYNDNEAYKSRGVIQIVGLCVGFLLSITLSLLVFFYLKIKHDSKFLEHANSSLVYFNAELENQRENALNASLAKSEFLSNMSHEIRTPLNAILGFADILEGKNLLKKERVYIKLMRNSAKSLLSLVNDILDIDKIESGKMELNSTNFKPYSKLKKILKTYAPQIEKKKLDFLVTIPEHSKNRVLADAAKFDQIITNLLGNAIKFTENGHIAVSYSEKVVKEQLQIELIISDTGVGIPKNKLNTIFERFIQIENGTRKKHGGGGLGLAITKELIDLFNGKVSVESECLEGTKFTLNFSFPIIDHKYSKEVLIARDLSHVNILIVDDNRLNRMILYNILLQVGIKAESVGSGKEALVKAEEKNYDVVFMDVHMPEMDGFETALLLRPLLKNALILGLSADVTLEAIEKGKAAGMDRYLTKPIDKKELFILLHKRFPLENELLIP